MGNHRLDANMETFSVKAMVEDVIELWEKYGDLSLIDFIIQIPNDNLKVVSDKRRIEQVLLSMLQNAVSEANN